VQSVEVGRTLAILLDTPHTKAEVLNAAVAHLRITHRRIRNNYKISENKKKKKYLVALTAHPRAAAAPTTHKATYAQRVPTTTTATCGLTAV
jgi:3-phenylpropionate/cinnamic acid dioxygenase small subunit